MVLNPWPMRQVSSAGSYVYAGLANKIVRAAEGLDVEVTEDEDEQEDEGVLELADSEELEPAPRRTRRQQRHHISDGPTCTSCAA